MTRFEINYTKVMYCSCIVEAQNAEQVRYLFGNDMLDLSEEHHGNVDLDKIRSIDPVAHGDEE
jgi:hypothetical protein